MFKHFAIANCNVCIACIGMGVSRTFNVLTNWTKPNHQQAEQSTNAMEKNTETNVCMIFKADNVHSKWMCVLYFECGHISSTKLFSMLQMAHIHTRYTSLHSAVAHNFYMIYTSLIPGPNCTHLTQTWI